MMMLLSISKIAVYSKPYVEFLEFKYEFHVCKKTSTILQLDDDDDIYFNSLYLNTKENQFHEINLKNKENIFIYSENEIIYLAKCSKIEAINIPKSIRACDKYIFIKYYEIGIHEPFLGYLQHNLIIRSDKESLDSASEFCLKRDELYIIGASRVSQKSNGKKEKYEEIIELLTGETSSVSLKELSKFKNIIEKANDEYGHKVFNFIENIGGVIIFSGACLGSLVIIGNI
jgi:hypothetical protein